MSAANVLRIREFKSNVIPALIVYSVFIIGFSCGVYSIGEASAQDRVWLLKEDIHSLAEGVRNPIFFDKFRDIVAGAVDENF